ncbi:flagellar protein FlgN [Wenzhouxiangella sp. AB-CW3]|uniref:flagella synthesis protein FlgN n=1 Tax=Wenzhouxiangella sp. AB-CW3 TaxID=2771012 RepID=UPI00168B3F45|nr:flagellar protein FlgN [Wenzhouxiangella sp. AB-CW3]QOC21232.1 flagellar protein FlgN [Wenzhouxiangella sp. AB-CW3]
MIRGPQQCARELAELFSGQHECAVALLEALEHEREALTSGDAAALETATIEKNALVERMEGLDRRQQQLLRSLPSGTSPDSMSQVLSWCDEDGSLARTHEQAAQRIIQCQQANQRNGLIVQQRLGHVRRALNILRDAHTDMLTYGPDGRSGPDGGSRLLAEG